MGSTVEFKNGNEKSNFGQLICNIYRESDGGTTINIYKTRRGSYGGRNPKSMSYYIKELDEFELVDFVLQNYLMIVPEASEEDKELYEKLCKRWRYYNR
jgi:hypothetical protein